MNHSLQESELSRPDRPIREEKARLEKTSFLKFRERVYLAALAIALGIWLLPIRGPFLLDETFSYWQIKAGFGQIWGRSSSWPTSVVYPYFLWLANLAGGKNEAILRVPSLLAALGAVYFLFRAAERLFGREMALASAIIFSLHTDVAFAAINARAYAFALLMTNVAAFLLVLWTDEGKTKQAVLFGLSCAGILYFHYLFAVVLPAFAIYYLVRRWGQPFGLRQLAFAAASFAVAVFPLVPLLLKVANNGQSHSFAIVPSVSYVLGTLTPEYISTVIIAAVIVAVIAGRATREEKVDVRAAVLCFAWALVPTAILYGVTASTQLHVFLPRYRLVATPGIALMWAWLLSLIPWKRLRQVACLLLAVTCAVGAILSPAVHQYSWKEAIEVAEHSASRDNAPVLMCSDYVESNSVPMPNVPADDNEFLSPLSFYPLTVPVVPLPRELNDTAKLTTSAFLQEATQRRQRFLMMAFLPSYDTIAWVVGETEGSFQAHKIGVFKDVAVVEFEPK